MARQEWCEDCRRLTAGSCWRHGPGVAEVQAISVNAPVCFQGHDFLLLRSDDGWDTFYCRRCLEYRTKGGRIHLRLPEHSDGLVDEG